MAASSSSITSFVQNYGSLFLPIAADYVTTAVFKRATCFGKARFAGLIVGVGVACYSASNTSWTIGLAGAALYTLYKTVTVFNSHPTHHKQHKQVTIADVENSFHQLLEQISYPSDRELNFTDPDFRNHLISLKDELKPQTDIHCQQWETPTVIAQTRSLMIHCQAFLDTIDGILEEQTQHLDPEARLQRKVELLNDESYENSHAFHQAFYMLTGIYRMIRCKAYSISLPNIQNFPEGKYESRPWGAELSLEYYTSFMQGDNPRRELKKLFNDTQEKLAKLLNLVYPNSPYLVKDEQPIPGDYSNPDNPFWIFPRETPVK